MIIRSNSRIVLGGCGLLAALALGAYAPSAVAATATATLPVTATVVSSCAITTGSLAFGNYSGAQVQASATISVTCTNNTPYSVGLNAGTGSGASVTSRKLSGPAGSTLTYALYQDTNRTTNWGNTPNSDTRAGNGNGAVQAMTVYGQIAAAQYVTPGAYTDTVTATVNY